MRTLFVKQITLANLGKKWNLNTSAMNKPNDVVYIQSTAYGNIN